MAAVALAAFALRMFHLGTQELRGDEAFGYFFSLNSLSEIVKSTIALREPHPVASYFLQHVWLALAGTSAAAPAKVLRYALVEDATTLDPLAISDIYSQEVAGSMRSAKAAVSVLP